MRDRPSEDITGLSGPLSELPWSADFVMQDIEILPVAMRDSGIWFFAPEHAPSFVVGWPAGEKPEVVAARAVEHLRLKPLVLHSTSWRHVGTEVVLTYLCVVEPTADPPESWRTAPMTRAELARGDATAPPQNIGVLQVQEHALRHLAWLTKDDPVIREELADWVEAFSGYVPEHFRAFGGPPDSLLARPSPAPVCFTRPCFGGPPRYPPPPCPPDRKRPVPRRGRSGT